MNTHVKPMTLIKEIDYGTPNSTSTNMVTLEIDEGALTGSSCLLLSALLNRLFVRHSGINSFVRTRSKLLLKQEEVAWPMTPGIRDLI